MRYMKEDDEGEVELVKDENKGGQKDIFLSHDLNIYDTAWTLV